MKTFDGYKGVHIIISRNMFLAMGRHLYWEDSELQGFRMYSNYHPCLIVFGNKRTGDIYGGEP